MVRWRPVLEVKFSFESYGLGTSSFLPLLSVGTGWTCQRRSVDFSVGGQSYVCTLHDTRRRSRDWCQRLDLRPEPCWVSINSFSRRIVKWTRTISSSYSCCWNRQNKKGFTDRGPCHRSTYILDPCITGYPTTYLSTYLPISVLSPLFGKEESRSWGRAESGVSMSDS